MPYDEDTVNAMAGAIAANMPIGHEGEYLNAMMKVILTVLAMADTKPEMVKEMFTHFYREYCKGLEDMMFEVMILYLISLSLILLFMRNK